MMLKFITVTFRLIFGRPNQRIVCDMDGFLEGMASFEKRKGV